MVVLTVFNAEDILGRPKINPIRVCKTSIIIICAWKKLFAFRLTFAYDRNVNDDDFKSSKIKHDPHDLTMIDCSSQSLRWRNGAARRIVFQVCSLFVAMGNLTHLGYLIQVPSSADCDFLEKMVPLHHNLIPFDFHSQILFGLILIQSKCSFL